MPTYIVLIDYTEHGIEHVKDTLHRVDALREQLKSSKSLEGVDFKAAWWTLGEHFDGINLFEAPDDETMAAASATIAEHGNARLTTMRAFTEDEMKGVLGKVA
jgi:uncharacterized protein with GYD domain